MVAYLKSVRRKMGVVTLLLACLTVTTWVRSRTLQDRIQIINDDRQMNSFLLTRRGLVWSRSQWPFPVFGLESLPWRWQWQTGSNEHGFSTTDAAVMNCVFYRMTFHGDPATGQHTLLLIRYWTLAIPLTALSAWLLFSRSRQANPQTALVSEASSCVTTSNQ